MEIIQSLKDIRRVLLTITFLLVFFVILSPPQDADMWWHLAAGKNMVEQGRILTTDMFSYTHRGEPWTNAFWLPDIVLFMAYRFGGYLGLTVLTALVAVVTMGVVYGHAKNSSFPVTLCVILLGTVAIAPVWTPRPQIFSFLLLAVLDYGLSSSQAFLRRRPWLLIGLFILWANVHGGFIWGFLLLLAFIVGKALDNRLKEENSLSVRELGQLGLWTLIAGLAVAINPNGIFLWKLPFYTVNVSIQSIAEWSSPDFHRLDLHPLLWLFFLLMIGAGRSKAALSWSSLLTVTGFSYMAFISQRSIGPFVVVVMPVVIHSLTTVWQEWSSLLSRLRSRRPSNSVSPGFAVVLHLLMLAFFASLTLFRAYSVSTNQKVHAGLPQNAVEAIRANEPEVQMFNSYNWGGYLQWELPEYPVFIDGRADLYGEQTIHDWWRIVNGTGEGIQLLDSWNINFVLLEPGWPILEELEQRGWRTLYEDDIAVVMER